MAFADRHMGRIVAAINHMNGGDGHKSIDIRIIQKATRSFDAMRHELNYSVHVNSPSKRMSVNAIATAMKLADDTVMAVIKLLGGGGINAANQADLYEALTDLQLAAVRFKTAANNYISYFDMRKELEKAQELARTLGGGTGPIVLPKDRDITG